LPLINKNQDGEIFRKMYRVLPEQSFYHSYLWVSGRIVVFTICAQVSSVKTLLFVGKNPQKKTPVGLWWRLAAIIMWRNVD
jgi:hypothetical protein